MASRADGSSQDSGMATRRLGTTSSSEAGRCSSISSSSPSTLPMGNRSGSKCTCSDRMPGVRSIIPVVWVSSSR
ncbi:Uncharacterised protein [Mycobacteroides abscessus subsp. abscessus]|nr:Uncharacterised protein [Mycobacteroides abscessus subsp. abscessus]